ncbi:MAG: PHP domain-containing protein [candidate division Zixibacteria bacterium]|nr:PHP domain-containing protein [candidate division Zixibacteria bacterium]
MSFTVDFHVHTINSYDSLNRPESIIKKAKREKLDAVVVLDHDTTKGGMQTAAINSADIIIIPAVEVKTDIGDIIGLYVRQEIESREYHRVIEEIRSQKGLVILPHPYHKHELKNDLFDLIDLIEINNARLSKQKNQLAKELAGKHGLPVVSGSDAHFPWEIGKCAAIFDNTPSSKEEFIETILKGERTHKVELSGKINIIASQVIKYLRRPESLLERLSK